MATSGPGNPARWALTLIVILAFIVPTFIAARYASLWHIYRGYVTNLSDITGLNIYVTRAAGALLFIPFSIGFTWSLSWRAPRRRAGNAILLGLFVLYNLALFSATRSTYFNFTEGTPLKWYAVTPDGVQLFDRPGIEPKYGITLQQVTKDIVHQLELMQTGDFKPIDPHTFHLFNERTGQSQAWFYRYPDGTFEFYDKPGFHPSTGAPLKPVTPEVSSEWQKKENDRASKAAQAASAARREAEFRQEKAAEAAARELAEARAADEARVRAQRIALVTVLSYPPGANVTIDRGKYRGVTPLTIELEPGAHGLRLALPGYKSTTDMITVNPPSAEVRYTLAPE